MRSSTTAPLATLLLAFSSAAAGAQVQPQGAGGAAAPWPAAQQIASAVLPVPAEFRASASVLGYGADGKLTTLREGTGSFVCLASDPKEKQFHVACYHRALEPFMARGRALRAQGITDRARVDSIRFAEVKSGKLAMPATGALYQLFGGTFDAAAGTVSGSSPLVVVYIPHATAESTGLSAKPSETMPWIMFPGTPKAHIMFSPRM
jgi:hypothetical protein